MVDGDPADMLSRARSFADGSTGNTEDRYDRDDS